MCINIVPFNGHFPFTLVKLKNNSLFCIKLHIRALLLELETLKKKINEKLFFSKLKKNVEEKFLGNFDFFRKKSPIFFRNLKNIGIFQNKKNEIFVNSKFEFKKFS